MRRDYGRLMLAGGMRPDPWQAKLLRSVAQHVLLLCSRQSGKSTVTAALALGTALFRPDSLILLLSPSLRQSGELQKKVSALYHRTGKLVPAAQESALSLHLANGSRIVSLPGTPDTVVGFSGVRLLVVDEASRVDDALYYAVRPMLAVSQGRLIALSTPFGKRGFFFREWEEGGAAWERYKITADQCARIPPAFLEKERRALGDRWYSQEYECNFVDTLDAVFTHSDIEAALTDDLAPLEF